MRLRVERRTIKHSAEKRQLQIRLGSLEAEIMVVLWETPGASVREVVERLRRGRAYTTVMTVMNRLVEKGLLIRSPAGRAFVYSPAMSESELIEQWTGKRIRELINDFGDVAVARFVGEIRDLGPEEFEKLRRLISSEQDET